MLWLSRANDNTEWETMSDAVDDGRLVVISQDCDIFAAPKAEPRIEALTVKWTRDASELHTARKGNSARLFLLQERDGAGLVADARRRVHLDKAALLRCSFEAAFHDERMRARFANWVAGRYNRPAVPNEIVDAIQKPVVSAVAELAKRSNSLLPVLDRVAEIRFAVAGERPWTVHLVIMLDDGDELSAEEEAELVGWLESVLIVSASPVGGIAPVFKTEKNISLHDYQNTTRLQLDHFTPEEDATRLD
jgi:hypothetical protein